MKRGGDADTVALWDIANANGPTRDEMYQRIGYIHKVYTRAEIETEKVATVANDVVIVELGSGQL